MKFQERKPLSHDLKQRIGLTASVRHYVVVYFIVFNPFQA